MSEYMEKHSVSRLVGAPPGYVGYDEGGQLTEAVRRNPYTIILLDEIEKAHPDVFNILLQVLDDGRLTDSKGVLVDFKNTVLIMTSNVGSQYLLDNVGENGEISEETTENVMSQLRAHFKPEFLNRIDDTILSALEDIKNIILKMTSQLAHRLEEMEVELELSEEVKVWIAENAYEPAYGARPLKRYLTKVIENPLAKLIIGGKIPPKSKVIVRLIDNKVDFDIQSIAE